MTDNTIPALAGTALLGLASDLQDFRAEREASRRNLAGREREAFIQGALWAAAMYRETVLAAMPPDGPQPDGSILVTDRETN